MKKKIPEIQAKNRQSNKKNKTSWKPGETGNPNGRPKKGTPITDFMRELFHAKPELKAQLVETLMVMALKGDIAAIREIMDRMEGKPTQTNEVQIEEMIPILPHVLRNNSNSKTSVIK